MDHSEDTAVMEDMAAMEGTAATEDTAATAATGRALMAHMQAVTRLSCCPLPSA
ncbi:MAG: hypothetical protein RIC87_18320 [Kiloniellales bacterium]